MPYTRAGRSFETGREIAVIAMREFWGVSGEVLKVGRNSFGQITIAIIGHEVYGNNEACVLDDLTALDVTIELERLLSKEGRITK